MNGGARQIRRRGRAAGGEREHEILTQDKYDQNVMFTRLFATNPFILFFINMELYSSSCMYRMIFIAHLSGDAQYSWF